MPITEQQRMERRNGIWASDVPKILGLDPYGSAYDVWLEKTGKLPDDRVSSDAADTGTRFEPAIVNWAEEQLGRLERDVELFDPALHLGAHLDARIIENARPVEAKTSGLYGPVKEEWGDYGTDDVPERVTIQTHVQMLLSKSDLCYVPAFIGGRGFMMYEIPFDKELAGRIAEQAIDFWENNVQADTPPEGEPALENLYRVIRVPHKVVHIDPQVVTEWMKAQDQVATAKKIENYWRWQVLKALGDGDIGDWGDPDRVFTFLEQTRKEYVVKATTFRVPRIVKRRKGMQ